MSSKHTSTTDSMSAGPSFDGSSYVVVARNASSPQRGRRRRSGSFGDLQPQLKRDKSQWEFEATFDDEDEVKAPNIVMTQTYYEPRKVKPLTGKDFMDGSDFLESTNHFRESQTSTRWNTPDVYEQPTSLFEQDEQQQEDEDDDIEQLFQELHVSLNTPSEKTGLHHHACKEKEADHVTEPTMPATATPSSSEPGRSQTKKKKKHKKESKKKSSKRKSSRLPSVVPPKEIDVSDCITVASSIGGLTNIRQAQTKAIPSSLLDTFDTKETCLPRPPLTRTQALNNTAPTHEVDISAQMTVASSIGHGSAWNKPKRKGRHLKSSPREIDISGPMTVQSSLGGESVRGRSNKNAAREQYGPLRRCHNAPLNLEKVASPVEIDVSDPTVVSSLGESTDRQRRLHYQTLPSESTIPKQYQSLHHRLYSSDSR